MREPRNPAPLAPKRVPWNKGKLIGAKPPLRPRHVWSIRTKLQVEGKTRDFALFDLAIDSKLRGCDVVALKVDDVAPNGYAIDRATVRQKKTGRPVKFELTEQTRQAVDDYLRAVRRRPGEFLFNGRGCASGHDDQAVRAARLRVGRGHRAGPALLRDPFAPANQGDPDLSTHGQSEGGSAPVRPHQNRKHGQVPWHRGR